MTIQSTQLQDLPEEIIRKILSKLPLKTLTISSCVSPKWLKIIKDIKFAKSYLKLNSEHKTLRSRLMVRASTGIHSLSLLDVRGVYDSSSSSSNGRRLHCPFNQDGRRIKLLGTSNGLVFASLNSYKNFYIWNPSTGFHLKLPDPEEFKRGKSYRRISGRGPVMAINSSGRGPVMAINSSGHRSVMVIDIYKLRQRGFGYVSTTDDYKAFLAIYLVDEFDESNLEQWVLVYSIKSQTWTRIENPYNPYLHHNTRDSHYDGILLNEKLHWLHIYVPGRYGNRYLDDDYADDLKEELKAPGALVFDLAENNFSKILFPAAIFADDDSKGLYHSLLGVFDGCLCLMRYEVKAINFVDFWVMKEYDVSESWTRLFRMNIYTRPHECMMQYLHPLLVMDTTILLKAQFKNEDNRLVRIDVEQDNSPEAYFEKPEIAFQKTLVYQETPLFLEKQKVKGKKAKKVETKEVSENKKGLLRKRKCCK